MRDRVQIAVDVILPQPYNFQNPLPVLIHQTRYWRAPEFKLPFKWLIGRLPGFQGRMIQEIVKSGYAFVNVDARGSGASFGSRAHPWTQDEIDDGKEVVDWVLKQAWASPNIGTLGISYTGASAEFLAGSLHPAIKSYMPLFSPHDVFNDIAVPRGIPHDGFIKPWGKFNQLLDQNKFPLPFPLAKMILKGVAPVNNDRKSLAKALNDHRQNRSVSETSKGIEFRDQAPANRIVNSIDDFSPHRMIESANRQALPIFAASGWFDGSYVHAAIRRFLSLESPVNKLVLGPWEHGGEFHISPGHSRRSSGDLVAMPIRFFDESLKGYDTGLAQVANVRYFTMGEEKWKESETWPPVSSLPAPLYFGKGGKLLRERPDPAGSELLMHQTGTGTGEQTRWRSLLGLVKTHHFYPDRREQTRLLLHFDTAALGRDLEITGHPIAELWVQTEEQDGTFFVYLDEVLPDGSVRYVTEGMLRALHRKELVEPQGELRDCVPVRSYRRADACPIPKNEPTLIRFDLLPTSYLFKKGNRIRISIATSDKDNFKVMCREASEYEILRGGIFASKVLLPVMKS